MFSRRDGTIRIFFTAEQESAEKVYALLGAHIRQIPTTDGGLFPWYRYVFYVFYPRIRCHVRKTNVWAEVNADSMDARVPHRHSMDKKRTNETPPP